MLVLLFICCVADCEEGPHPEVGLGRCCHPHHRAPGLKLAHQREGSVYLFRVERTTASRDINAWNLAPEELCRTIWLGRGNQQAAAARFEGISLPDGRPLVRPG